MKVAMQPAAGSTLQASVPSPAFVLSARPFILTCLTCGPTAAFARADSLDEAETKSRTHAAETKHPLGLIYFDRAWGFAQAAVKPSG